jgi:hypothetical protein
MRQLNWPIPCEALLPPKSPPLQQPQLVPAVSWCGKCDFDQFSTKWELHNMKYFTW